MVIVFLGEFADFVGKLQCADEICKRVASSEHLAVAFERPAGELAKQLACVVARQRVCDLALLELKFLYVHGGHPALGVPR